jgi:2,3,4,5-tetrahydropyridine-2,6-dicarboxylate N-succinyltransferase
MEGVKSIKEHPMNSADQSIIEQAWEEKGAVTTSTHGDVRNAVARLLLDLDKGIVRVTTKESGVWVTHEWIKKGILLSFRLNPMQRFDGAPAASGMQAGWYDKVPSKFQGWSEGEFAEAGFRAVPGAIVRHSAFIAKDVVLMPSFVNLGAYVGEGTMIDTWSTVGSCAQIGKHCHISGGVGIGGVLEPLQANPVIIEDNCFIGARSEVAEGVVVEEGSVISMGVFLGASTKIIDRATGEVHYGRVPAYSVVIAGTVPPSNPLLPDGSPAPSLACAVIVKQVDAKTRSKTGINEILRAAV